MIKPFSDMNVHAKLEALLKPDQYAMNINEVIPRAIMW